MKPDQTTPDLRTRIKLAYLSVDVRSDLLPGSVEREDAEIDAVIEAVREWVLDRVILTMMGGEETVRVERVTAAMGQVRWHGWSPVMGEVSDTLHEDRKVRLVA